MNNKTKPRRQRLWVLMGTLAVIVVWLVSACANWWAGHTLSNNQVTALVLGGASVSIDVLKAVMLFALASAVTQRKWLVSLLCLTTFLLCSIWAMRSATYFASTMLTQHAAERSHTNKTVTDRRDTLDIKKSRLKFLAQQDLTVNADNKYARREMLKERKRIQEQFDALSKEIEREETALASSKVVGASDPLAQVLNLDDGELIRATSVYFAVLLEVVSAIGMWLIAESRMRAFRDGPPPPSAQAPAQITTKRGPLPPNPGTRARSNGKDRSGAFAENVIDLSPHQRPALGSKAALKKQIREIVAAFYEAGNPDDRVLLADMTARVNSNLSRSYRRLTGQDKAVSAYLIPAAVDLNRHAACKSKIGGKVWVRGIRERSGACYAASAQ